jgi:hypothetical protein
MALTTNTNLSQPAWTNVTNAIQSTGSTLNTSVPIDGTPARFYRLQSN